MSIPNVKSSLLQMDNEVLFQLMYAAQFALNDVQVIKDVAKDIGQPECIVESLLGIAIDLMNSDGDKPSICTFTELTASAKELQRL